MVKITCGDSSAIIVSGRWFSADQKLAQTLNEVDFSPLIAGRYHASQDYAKAAVAARMLDGEVTDVAIPPSPDGVY